MEEEKQNVNEEVVQPEDENQEVVNPEETQESQETETPTPEQGETQEPEEQRVPYERFKEKVDEVNWYKNQLEQTIQRPQPQQPQQPQTQDPYAGMDAATEKFYRDLDVRTRKTVQEEQKKTNQIIEAGKYELAELKTAQFRRDHSDIKPGSIEEKEIGAKIVRGLSTDDAYWSVMGPRGIQPAVNKAKKQEQQKFQQKRQANVESSPGIPNSSLPANQKSERDTIGEALDESPAMQ